MVNIVNKIRVNGKEYVAVDHVLEIIDDADKKSADKTYIVLDDGRFYSQAKYIKERMKELCGISLCDTCSNCECVFQSGVVREQCDFYKSIAKMTVMGEEYMKYGKFIKDEEQYDCRTIDAVLEIVNQLKDSRKEQRKVSGDMESGIQYACIAIERRIRHRLGINGGCDEVLHMS